MCSLQERNSALASENESQREQYERCLDEVSSGPCLSRLTPGSAYKGAARLAGCFTYLENSESLFVEFVFNSCNQNVYCCRV